jgi:hypothetical protein
MVRADGDDRIDGQVWSICYNAVLANLEQNGHYLR